MTNARVMQVATSLNSALANYWKTMYPIGSIYISINNVNPSTFWGGTWESIGSGRVLWGADSTHSAGTTIEAELPNIKGMAGPAYGNGHAWNYSGAFYEYARIEGNSASSGYNSAKIGFDASRSNSIYKDDCNTVQPPAYCVYFWKRTA